MALTRGNVLDRVAAVLGESSNSNLRTYLTVSTDQQLFALFDAHDWNFKHKVGSFSTAIGTEGYDLSSTTADIRSSQDVELIYDYTEGNFLFKIDLKNIRKVYPKEDQTGDPTHWAPWGGDKNIILHPNPDAVNTMKYLYVAKPTLPTSDSDNLETVCGLPDYMHYVFEKMMLAEGLLFYDDTRRNALLEEISRIWLPKAIEADMRHLENTARFKMWEEDLYPYFPTYNDFLRHTFSE